MPVEITFRNTSPSPALEAAIQRWVDRLVRIEPRMVRCAVVVERPHRKQRSGQPFHIRVEVAIPDGLIVVGRDPAHDDAHTDAYVAVADAFRAARRQLQDAIEIRRGDVKLHA